MAPQVAIEITTVIEVTTLITYSIELSNHQSIEYLEAAQDIESIFDTYLHLTTESYHLELQSIVIIFTSPNGSRKRRSGSADATITAVHNTMVNALDDIISITTPITGAIKSGINEAIENSTGEFIDQSAQPVVTSSVDVITTAEPAGAAIGAAIGVGVPVIIGIVLVIVYRNRLATCCTGNPTLKKQGKTAVQNVYDAPIVNIYETVREGSEDNIYEDVRDCPEDSTESSIQQDSTENIQPGPADTQPDTNTTEPATENTPPDAYYKFFFQITFSKFNKNQTYVFTTQLVRFTIFCQIFEKIRLLEIYDTKFICLLVVDIPPPLYSAHALIDTIFFQENVTILEPIFHISSFFIVRSFFLVFLLGSQRNMLPVGYGKQLPLSYTAKNTNLKIRNKINHKNRHFD